METVATFGCVLQGLILEAVQDPHRCDHLFLHYLRDREFKTKPSLQLDRVVYLPKPLSGALPESVRLAPPSSPFGSTGNLMSLMGKFLATYLTLQPEATTLFLAFALATWFVDLMPMAPVMFLFGPESEISHALRLLACLCRRAVLLSDVSLGSLATLPAGLDATLLVNQLSLDRRVLRDLLASSRRHFRIARGRGCLHIYGAKALACDESMMEQAALRVSLSPRSGPFQTLSDAQESECTRTFQSRLLRYRMLHYAAVRDWTPDCSILGSALREQAGAWLAPIRECPELTEKLSAEIFRQAREFDANLFSDPRCIVAEAALHHCHKNGVDHFFVGEAAATANALLRARHEEMEFSPKQVGTILRELGIPSQRVAQGFRVELNQHARARIHHVASAHRVLSVDGVQRCRHCKEGTKPSTTG